MDTGNLEAFVGCILKEKHQLHYDWNTFKYSLRMAKDIYDF